MSGFEHHTSARVASEPVMLSLMCQASRIRHLFHGLRTALQNAKICEHDAW